MKIWSITFLMNRKTEAKRDRDLKAAKSQQPKAELSVSSTTLMAKVAMLQVQQFLFKVLTAIHTHTHTDVTAVGSSSGFRHFDWTREANHILIAYETKILKSDY